jgi:polysaccharide biosynthesis/export protein
MSSQRIVVPVLFVAWALGSAPSLAQTPSPAATPGTTNAPVAPAVGQPSSPPATPSPNGAVDPSEYRIGPEDVLNISVWKNEAISRTVPVRPDGKITLPLLNDIVVAGLTPMEFRELLIQKLAEYMPSPEVSVIVVDPRSFKVSVMGEVVKPGRYELRSRTTVLDMLALVGGLNQFASRTKIFVLRPDGTTQKRLPFNYNKAVTAGGEQENFYLQAGDIVVVP